MEDRWNAALTLAQSKSEDDKDRKSVSVNRYEHDMEQARAMRRKGPVNPDDVVLGLNGLDEADNLREHGELASALKLYELALELLIRVIGSSDSDLGDIDRGTLQARVRVGFSSAESVKAKLKSQSSQRPSESSGEQSSKKDAFQSLSTAISSALKSSPRQQVSARPAARPAQRKQTSGRGLSGPRQRNDSSRVLSVQAAGAKSEIRESILSDLYVRSSDLQKTHWDDIAGLKNVKQALQEAAILPLMRPDLFIGLRRPQNLLLFGPPGTGKTMLVRAVSHESGCNLFVCTASSLTSKWMGESEKLVRELFQVAREMAPSIIFIDEMDSLLSVRKSDGEHEASRRLKTEFMVQMEGITKDSNSDRHVLVLACTNCPWDVDPAVIRRFPRRLYVPLPDREARQGLLEHLLKKAGKHSISARQVKELAQRMEGFSCSDITSIASEASFGPLRSLGDMKAIRNVREKDVRPIDFKDFERAINEATQSVGPEQLHRYVEWQERQRTV